MDDFSFALAVEREKEKDITPGQGEARRGKKQGCEMKIILIVKEPSSFLYGFPQFNLRVAAKKKYLILMAGPLRPTPPPPLELNGR